MFTRKCVFCKSKGENLQSIKIGGDFFKTFYHKKCLYDIICIEQYCENKKLFIALDIVSMLNFKEMKEKIQKEQNDTKRRRRKCCEYLQNKINLV